jgi:S-DNA-T family DNA segregation ATPase FtsK/SpoIIIE
MAAPDAIAGRGSFARMAGIDRTAERRVALRFCLVTIGWLACLFGWVCFLTFDPADAPSCDVWPHPDSPHNLCGPVGATIAYYAFLYLGVAVYPLLFLLNSVVLAATRGGPVSDPWLRFLGFVLVGAAFATAAALTLPPSDRYLITGPGGLVGAALAGLLFPALQAVGTWLLLALVVVVGTVLAADNVLMAIFRALRWASQQSAPALSHSPTVSKAQAADEAPAARREHSHPERERFPPVNAQKVVPARTSGEAKPPRSRSENEQPEEDRGRPTSSVAERLGGRKPAEDVADARAVPSPNAPPVVERAPLVREAARVSARAAATRTTAATKAGPDEDYELPPIELLERPIPVDRGALEALCREKAYILEQTLNEFRLEVQVVAIETGPVITVFELKLAPGIKVSQVASLSNDMARALKAPAVRVVAPLPGKSTIGIEVPNIDKEKVRLRDVIESSASRIEHYGIPLFLGKDASGQPLVADLTRMPHLLIAGTTGSGKSVCITSLIMSVLMTRSPSEVQMILIDPKVVELAAYRDIPHLMCPIVTEVARAEAILDWASTKMDERYALLAEAGVKDIRSYNRLGLEELRARLRPSNDEEMAKIPVHLPYIVIVVDELADLMMTTAKEVEFHLCRIAQKSRAVGIHLIVSTQRPQANVVTGLIKSNMPCRIAFRVASRLDSRIVLDQNGGEVLMGQGDMLFLPPGSSKLVRAQGTYVDDEELKRVVRHCREQRPQVFHPELVRLPGSNGAPSNERDELFDQAVEAIIETQRGSVSLLQRRFNIGYTRASRLIDQMYAAGIVGEYKGSQAREVIVTKEEWEAIKARRDREEAEEAAREPQAE